MSEPIHRATRELLLNGQVFPEGTPISLDGISRHRLKQLIATRKVTVVESDDVAANTELEAPESPVADLESAGDTLVAPDAVEPVKRSRKRRGASHYR